MDECKNYLLDNLREIYDRYGPTCVAVTRDGVLCHDATEEGCREQAMSAMKTKAVCCARIWKDRNGMICARRADTTVSLKTELKTVRQKFDELTQLYAASLVENTALKARVVELETRLAVYER